MPLPGDLTTIVVTASYPQIGSAAMNGQVVFTPSDIVTDGTGHGRVTRQPVIAPVSAAGAMTPVTLICTDNVDLVPSGWTWTVTEQVPGAGDTYSILLPSTLGVSVDLSDVAPVIPTTGMAAFLQLSGGTMTGPLFLAAAKLQNLASAPVSPATGQIYFDTTLGQFGYYNGTGWVYGGGNVTQSGSSAGAGRLKVSAGASTAITDYAGGAGLVKTTSGGVASPAAANTDYAPPASPVFTGTPTAPTAAALDGSTKIATTAYTDSAVGVETSRAESAEGVNATAISAEAARAAAAEALKAPLASPALTGSPTAPTQTTGDSSTKIATDAFTATAVGVETTRAEAAEALLAPLASPTKTVTTTNTTLTTDSVTLCDATSGGFINTLPSAAVVSVGVPYVFKKTDATANEVRLLPVSSQTIDGATYLVLASPNAGVTLRSNGTNWGAF